MSSLTDNLQVRIDDLIKGIEADGEDPLEQVADVKVRKNIEGQFPFSPTKNFLGRDEDAPSRSMGAVTKFRNMDVDQVSYVMEKYHSGFKVNEFKMADFDQYFPVLETGLEGCREDVRVQKALDMNTELTDNTLNEEVSASDPWDDGGTASTPGDDLEAADDLIGRMDEKVVVVGQNVLRALRGHSEVASISGAMFDAGGKLPEEAARSYIREVTGASTIMTQAKLYDANEEGLDHSLDFANDDLFWMGARRGLKYIKHEKGGRSKVWEDKDADIIKVKFVEPGIVKRAITDDNRGQELGVFISGIITP